jgi:pimeloyl-ACP methyl ester carboxylesterase
MRRLLAAPLLLAALAALAVDPPPADAQAAKPTEESFTTADGVRLKGLFHKSPNGNKQGDAVVVLLYPPGPERSMLKGDWDGLIGKLNEAGFHVFRFDWRGHGQSTDITDPLGDMMNPYNGFFVNRVTGAWNQKYVKGGTNLRKAPNDLRVKGGITLPQYFPVFVNDLAAARLHLDQKNDQGELNTSSIYLVGAGDTATLGMMWLASEWQRPAVAPTLGGGLQYKVTPMPGIVVDPPAGADVAGAIWLSAGRPSNVPEYTVQGWARSALKLRDNNKMLFLYGADDKAAQRDAEAFFNKVLVAKGNRALGLAAVEQTFELGIPKTKLNGVALLGQKIDPQPEAKILEYLTARQKDRVSMVRKQRNFVSPYYVDVNYYMALR